MRRTSLPRFPSGRNEGATHRPASGVCKGRRLLFRVNVLFLFQNGAFSNVQMKSKIEAASKEEKCFEGRTRLETWQVVDRVAKPSRAFLSNSFFHSRSRRLFTNDGRRPCWAYEYRLEPSLEESGHKSGGDSKASTKAVFRSFRECADVCRSVGGEAERGKAEGSPGLHCLFLFCSCRARWSSRRFSASSSTSSGRPLSLASKM